MTQDKIIGLSKKDEFSKWWEDVGKYEDHNGAIMKQATLLAFKAGQSSKAQPTPRQSEPVALMDSVGVCAITLHMVKELEGRGNPFPYDMWPTKLYTSPQPTSQG